MNLETATARMRPLVGREQEVRTVCVRLQETTVRLLTLTGPGGVGKTRLAMQVATEMVTHSSLFPDGCFFVSLAALREKELVLPAVIQALGLKEPGQQPLELLKVVLREKRLLLVLDNFEQVIEAAPVLIDLLVHCLSLKIMITSRTVVHLYDEYVFQVVPLALPDLHHLPDNETLTQFPAVALFLQRVQKVLPEFSLSEENAHVIAEICIRLDGLPLALELAAARMKLLTPQSLLTRLNRRLVILTGAMQDVSERQQTLRQTLEWSYQLLSPREQLLFQRLAAFAGGVSLQSLEAVWAILEGQADDVLDLVTSLVDKNLLQVLPVKEGDDPRFLLLETLHEYALECLEGSGKLEQTRQVHALHYLALAEELAPKLISAEQARYMGVLEQEADNLRAAVGWLLASEQVEYALRLCLALLMFWMVYRIGEGYRHIIQALALVETQGTKVDASVKAWAYYIVAAQARFSGHAVQALAYCETSLKLFREADDQQGSVVALNGLGHLALEREDAATLQVVSDESLRLTREVGDPWRLAEGLFLSAFSAYLHGTYSEARKLIEESFVLCRAIGEPHSLIRNSHALALFAYAQGDETTLQRIYEETRTFVESALAMDPGVALAGGLVGLGSMIALQGHLVRAVQLWGAGKVLFDGININIAVEDIHAYLGIVLPTQLGYEKGLKLVRGQLSDQAFKEAWDAGQTMPLAQLLQPLSQIVAAPFVSLQNEKKATSSRVFSREKLTPRESEVLRLVAEGLTSSQIAQRLNITLLTVNSHVRSIYSKLGITTRSAATRYVLEQKM